VRRGVLGLLGAILLLTACGGGDDDDAGGERERSDGGSEESSTTAGGNGSTTSTVAVQGPEEWVEVASDINQRDHELLLDPDLDRITDVYSPECPCIEEERTTVQSLIDNGWHMEGEPPTVLAVQHQSTEDVPLPDSDQTVRFVTLVVMRVANALQAIDAQGDVAQEYAPEETEPTCVTMSLRLDADDVYRVTDERPIECPTDWE
jgi:hypothetical protein